MAIYLGDDRRRLVPSALVQVLSVLIDEIEDGPSATRAELRALRSRLCRLYRIDDPLAPANTSSVAQMMEHEDNVPFEE